MLFFATHNKSAGTGEPYLRSHCFWFSRVWGALEEVDAALIIESIKRLYKTGAGL